MRQCIAPEVYGQSTSNRRLCPNIDCEVRCIRASRNVKCVDKNLCRGALVHRGCISNCSRGNLCGSVIDIKVK